MSVIIQGDQVRSVVFGATVTKTALAVTGISTKPIFTVTGGKILVTSFVGEVSTVIQAQATLTKIVATPTVGAVNDLSATVDIASLAVGALFGITGLAADAAVVSTGGGVSNIRNPVVVKAGVVGVNTAASSTGAITFTMTYVPLDTGASVAAA